MVNCSKCIHEKVCMHISRLTPEQVSEGIICVFYDAVIRAHTCVPTVIDVITLRSNRKKCVVVGGKQFVKEDIFINEDEDIAKSIADKYFPRIVQSVIQQYKNKRRRKCQRT